MSLRRSARARVSAADLDVVTGSGGERRKRKRSNLTPETSQSPGKAGSPNYSDDATTNATAAAKASSSSSSSPSATTARLSSSSRKIVVKTPSTRKSQSDSIPTLNNGLADLKSENVIEEDDELQELLINDEDRHKLEAVLKIYAPDLLIQKGSVSSRESEQEMTSLQQILSQPSCSIRRIRNQILAMRAPLISATALRTHLSSSHISPPIEEIQTARKKLSLMAMALSLIDEIAARTRLPTLNKMESVEQDKQMRKSDDEYALQMRLPSGDYFTNAVRLPIEEALRLDTGYSKMIGIVTQPVSLDTRPPPTLKERLPTFKYKGVASVDSTEEDVARPVSYLYYNPWSSFAPTYDAFDGNISQQASSALWRARKADQVALEEMTEEPVSKRQQLEEMLESLDDVDADAVLAIYDEIKQPASLEKNAQLLRRLEELQTKRWNRTFAKRLLYKSSLLEEPNEEERKVAGEILDTLSQLLDQHSGSLSQIIPSAKTLQAASNSACIDPDLMNGKGEAGYWGSLNESLYGPHATRRVTGARSAPVRPPAAIRDNETIRMEPANEEKVSVIMTQMGTTTKGRGLLDRFASKRQYNIVDHPHDRSIIAPPSASSQSHPPSHLPPGQAAPQHQSLHSQQQQKQQQQQPQRANPVGRPPLSTPRPSKFLSPPMSTPPARPLYNQMRPSPVSTPYSQQQQKMAFYRPMGGGQPQRPWSQSPQSTTTAAPFFPARPPTADYRLPNGSSSS